ncbi:MAG: glycosyltransferase family 39 protein [Candidatus Eisenbacteria bacterium]|jgi:hypothetical protein|nr:glycosyltransferase family 39 protein [Candidatus Eisenbacteria bacterium]
MVRKPAFGVFLLALFVRLAFVIPKGPDLMRPLEDQRLYLRMGRAVAEGKGLTLTAREYHPLEGGEWKRQVSAHWIDPYDPGMGVAEEGKQTAIIEPLYPLLLGGIHRLYPGSIPFIRIIQAALGALTAVALFAAGASVNRRVGVLAGLGFALFPHAIYYAGMVTTETLFIALQALAAAAWAAWLTTPGPGRAAVFGLACGCAFLARSAMLPLSGLALAVAAIADRRTVRMLPVVVAGFALAVAPWVIRNGVAMGEYRLMPTKDGLNLWMQNHPAIQQLQLERIGMPIPESMLNTLSCRELEEFPLFPDSMPEIERNRVLSDRAQAYIRCNPRYFAYLCWLRLRWYLRFSGSTVRSDVADLVGGASFSLLLALALAGAVRGWRHPMVALSVLGWLAYLGMHALFHGGIRYRIPADSLLIIAAAHGADQLLRLLGRGRG